MPLNDYEYQYKQNGIVLNKDTSEMPFWDVIEVIGLTDHPDYKVVTQDLDGAHGAITHAEFLTHRTIVIAGNLYADPDEVDQLNEALRETLIPDGLAHPFFFKQPGLQERYLSCLPVAYRADVDRGRRNGIMLFQITLRADDPRMYRDHPETSFIHNVGKSISNAGNVPSYPRIAWTVGTTGSKNVSVSDGTGTIAFTRTLNAGDDMVIDTQKRLVRRNGALMPVDVDVTNRWPFLSKGSTTLTVQTGGDNGTIAARDAWL